jgi:hypothetical protein
MRHRACSEGHGHEVPDHSPRRVDALVHAELGGRPYMAYAFEKMIRYVRQHDDVVWHATVTRSPSMC